MASSSVVHGQEKKVTKSKEKKEKETAPAAKEKATKSTGDSQSKKSEVAWLRFGRACALGSATSRQERGTGGHGL